jgi:hypothetical protein
MLSDWPDRVVGTAAFDDMVNRDRPSFAPTSVAAHPP